MPGVEEIITGVRSAAAKIAASRSWLQRAREKADDAGQTLARETQGSNAHEIQQAMFLFAEAAGGIDSVDQVAGRAPAHLDTYIAAIEGDADPGGSLSGSSPKQPTPPSAPRTDHEDRVQRAQQELPPPVTRGRGAKTHGRLLTDDGNSQAVTSGQDEWTEKVNQAVKDAGCPYTPMTAAADVELKVAAQMRATGIRHATVVINNRPCTGRLSCDDLLGVVLPEGSSLTVHGTGGFKKTYKGGKRWE